MHEVEGGAVRADIRDPSTTEARRVHGVALLPRRSARFFVRARRRTDAM